MRARVVRVLPVILGLELRGKIKTRQEMVKRTDLATVITSIEGTLTEAVKNGDWILLDDLNMAPAYVLECLSQLLEGEGSITLYEAGDYKSIPRHKDFRLFACMNPATDTAKTDLALACGTGSQRSPVTRWLTRLTSPSL